MLPLSGQLAAVKGHKLVPQHYDRLKTIRIGDFRLEFIVIQLHYKLDSNLHLFSFSENSICSLHVLKAANVVMYWGKARRMSQNCTHGNFRNTKTTIKTGTATVTLMEKDHD